MCVIIYKKKGVEMPDYEILRSAHEANPNGCGFCTPNKSYRGLSFKQFMREIRKVDTEEPCLIHFRLATNGSVKKKNCHPFYDGATDTWFMHNGILNVRTYKDMTDSEIAFRENILPYIRTYGLDSYMVDSVVKHLIGYSRFAFMQGDEVKLFGDFVEVENVYYSNLRFLYHYRLHI